MFMTLSNIQINSTTGLLFPDRDTGTLLYLPGNARINWDDERSVDFTVEEVVQMSGTSPLPWSAPELSRAQPVNCADRRHVVRR